MTNIKPAAGALAPRGPASDTFRNQLARANDGATAQQTSSNDAGSPAQEQNSRIARPVTGDRRQPQDQRGRLITGDNGDNRLRGTRGNDTIIGLGGDDRISGGKGNDFINAGAGNDTVNSGRGNDTVLTGGGFDTVRTGAGNDTVVVEGGAFVNGGRGNDTVLITGRESDYTSTGVPNGTLYQNKNTGDYIGVVNVENVRFTQPDIVVDGPDAIAPPPREDILGSWTLDSIAGKPAVPGREPTISFNDDGTVTGSDGVNRFWGTFTYQDGNVTFGPISSTKVGTSDPALIEQSRAFANTVLGAEKLRLNPDNNLLTIDQDSGQVATLTPADGGPGTPPAEAGTYAGFTVDTQRPASDVVTVNGQQYSLGFIRDAVNTLNTERPYSGPVTLDFRQPGWGQGSGTGLNLISNYLTEIAPNGEPGLSNPGTYAGFTVDTQRPASDVVTVNGQQYSLGFIRDAVNTLNTERPYSGPVTLDFRQPGWGQGSGTGLNLISNYLTEIAPNGEPGLSNPGTYAGFTVDTQRPASDVVTVNGQQYSLGFIRDAVNTLNTERPFTGNFTTDFRQPGWGQGSSTGQNLISNYLTEIAPNGQPGLDSVTPVQPGGPGASPVVGQWKVQTFEGDIAVPEDRAPTITFTEDGQVSGSDGTNTFKGTYTIENGVIRFGPISNTRAGATDQQGVTIANLFANTVLDEGNTFRITTNGSLVLTDQAGNPSASLAPYTPLTLQDFYPPNPENPIFNDDGTYNIDFLNLVPNPWDFVPYAGANPRGR